MKQTNGNLFSGLNSSATEELTSVLTQSANVRIERIVSTGQASAEGFWYDQSEHEWVAVLEGEAIIEFENGDSKTMKPGDFIQIPKHCRHRVAWTTPNKPTVWLAVFFS
ncbi:MAG: cupin domain-containing protein [Pirellulaceae bacterium]